MRKLLRDIIFRTLTEAATDDCDVLAVFDFDDTLVTSNSKVIVTHANGTKEEMKPAEYATYEQQKGDKFDYSQFDKVMDADPTAIFNVFTNMIKDCGVDSVAILTARGSNAQLAIKEFFNDLGIKLKDIITVGSSNPNAKALEIRKFANLYKPSVIHFYDDAKSNIDAVKKIAATHPDLQDIDVITHQIIFDKDTGEHLDDDATDDDDATGDDVGFGR